MNQLIKNFRSKFSNCINNTIDFSKKEEARITSFIDEFPFLTSNKIYIEFLKTYSGLSYFNDQTDEDFTLFGFNNSGIVFRDQEVFDEPILDNKGYLLFGHLSIPQNKKFIDFVFDQKDPNKIYLKQKTEEETFNYHFVTDSFEEFLLKIYNQEIR